MLRVDTDGIGFLHSTLVDGLHLQRAVSSAYLPPIEDNGFPMPTGNRGALSILSESAIDYVHHAAAFEFGG